LNYGANISKTALPCLPAGRYPLNYGARECGAKIIQI